jgi:pyridoxine kinase
VLTTTLRRRDADADTIEMLAVSGEGAWLVQTPMLALEVNGAGDATAALFLAHLLRGAALAEALSMTASAVYAVLEETRRTGSREMRLVSAQESIGEPPHRFEARQVR